MSALGSFFVSRARDVRVWQGISLIALAAIPVTNQMTLAKATQEERFFAMDDGNYYYVTRVGTFQDAKKFHQGAADDALAAMFNRTSSMFAKDGGQGFDLPEAIDRLFDLTTRQQLKDEAVKDADQFRRQTVWQWADVPKLKEEWVKPTMVNFTAEVEVITVRTIDGRNVAGSRTAKVRFTMVKNTNFATNGYAPMVVTWYEKTFL
jgi:hypothetical protein